MYKQKTITTTLILFIFFTSLITQARIWKDKKGNNIEAELISVRAGTVFLKTEKGKTLRVPKKSLCEEDQSYLENAIPPKVKIVFKKNQDRRGDAYWSSSEVYMRCQVTITKTSQPKYTGSLKATVLVIGKNMSQKYYMVLDKVTKTFSFEESKTFSIKGNRFHMYQDNYDSYGEKYMGFVVVITDKENHLVGIISNRKEFKKEYKKLIEMGKGAHFDRKFECM